MRPPHATTVIDASRDLKCSTSGLVRLTMPQLVGTLIGLRLGALLAAIDQTIVGINSKRQLTMKQDQLPSRDVHVSHHVLTRRQKSFEVGVGQDERGRVDVGMKRDARRQLQLAIEIDANVMIMIVDQPER